MILRILVLALLVVGAGESWESYGNHRFGYHLEYPGFLLKPLPEAENGDGLHFKPLHGHGEFSAWGSYLQDDGSFAAAMQMTEAECAGGKASYKLARATVWVVSCPLAKGGVLYDKAIRLKDAQSVFEARYPAAEKDLWDAVAARMAVSLSAPHPEF